MQRYLCACVFEDNQQFDMLTSRRVCKSKWNLYVNEDVKSEADRCKAAF